MDNEYPVLQRIAEGDEAALSLLMESYEQPLFRFALRYLRNEADAAEVVQAAFIRAYNNAQSFKPKAKVSTWLFQITSNLCKDQLRKNKRYSQHHPIDEQEVAVEHCTPYEEVESTEAMKELKAAIHALPHKLKTPFVLCVLEEHSYKSCATILKTTVKTVETRIARARKILRERIK